MDVRLQTVPGLRGLVLKAAEISGARGNAPRVSALAGDGSDRKFYRICCGTRSFVGLISPRVRTGTTDENDSYLRIGLHLHARSIPVPRIFHADALSGRFLLEDAGDCHLQKHVLAHRKDIARLYRPVIRLLAGLHKRAREGFQPAFCFDGHLYSPAFVYERELEYFRKSFCNGYLGLDIGPEELRPDFENLAEEAGARRTDFVFHRDFQSRNIMVRLAGLKVIDFQGMRFGPPAYDLASLLMDPYAAIPEDVQDGLLQAYWASAAGFLGCGRGEFLRSYRAVRLCRNLQILGAFGFLGIVKGKRQFLRYVPWAWTQLLGHLRVRCKGRYPRLEKVSADIRGALTRT